MGEGERFKLEARARSFGHAFRGIGTLLATQHNARIHAGATVAACAAGLWLGISRLEWCCVAIAAAAVWTAEALNTALEILCDAAVPESHPLVGRAKDVAAAAVLVSAAGAALVGLLIFGPRLLALFV
jgi:diacylglycerol kinase (ATP)